VNEWTLVKRLLLATRGEIHVAVVAIDETVGGAHAVVRDAGAVELAHALVVTVAVQVETETAELTAVGCAMGQQCCKHCVCGCCGAQGVIQSVKCTVTLLSITGTEGKREMRSEKRMRTTAQGKRSEVKVLLPTVITKQLTVLVGLRHDGGLGTEVHGLHGQRHPFVARRQVHVAF
jgi:hypothetical protein